MKKWFIPIIYLVFGFLVYFLESDVIRFDDGTAMNVFNIRLFSIIPVIVLGILVIKKVSLNLSKKIFLIFMAYNTVTYVMISLFWITFLTWK